jgi:hypothetical protein
MSLIKRQVGAIPDLPALAAENKEKTRRFRPGQLINQYIATGYFRLDLGHARWLTSKGRFAAARDAVEG